MPGLRGKLHTPAVPGGPAVGRAQLVKRELSRPPGPGPWGRGSSKQQPSSAQHPDHPLILDSEGRSLGSPLPPTPSLTPWCPLLPPHAHSPGGGGAPPTSASPPPPRVPPPTPYPLLPRTPPPRAPPIPAPLPSPPPRASTTASPQGGRVPATSRARRSLCSGPPASGRPSPPVPPVPARQDPAGPAYLE